MASRRNSIGCHSISTFLKMSPTPPEDRQYQQSRRYKIASGGVSTTRATLLHLACLPILKPGRFETQGKSSTGSPRKPGLPQPSENRLPLDTNLDRKPPRTCPQRRRSFPDKDCFMLKSAYHTGAVMLGQEEWQPRAARLPEPLLFPALLAAPILTTTKAHIALGRWNRKLAAPQTLGSPAFLNVGIIPRSLPIVRYSPGSDSA